MKRSHRSMVFGNISVITILMILTCIGMQTVLAADSDALITTWKTDNTGSSNNTSITVPMVNGYWSVNWGDGTNDSGLLGPKTHDYGVAGTYTVKIWVGFGSINFRDSGDKAKILSIDQWGTSMWGNGSSATSMAYAFADLTNLEVLARDNPNFSHINDMSGMFARSPQVDPDTTNWDTSAVLDMSTMFSGATAANPNVSNWDTALVTDMHSMFEEATSADPDVSNWNTGKVTTMEYMFQDATSANPNVSSWNTGKVTNMGSMFQRATSFDQDLGAWNVGALNWTREIFDGITLSTENYDSLLIGWGGQTLQKYNYIWAGGSVYCSSEAAAARNHMMTEYGWVFYDGGRCPLPPSDPLTAPDLAADSDSGLSSRDDLTNKNTPYFDVACSKSGNTITLYTDNPSADTPTGTHICTDPGTETAKVLSDLVDGVHHITYTDQTTAGESGHSPSLEVTIDTVAPPQPVCSTSPASASDGVTVITTCTGVEESAFIYIPNMQCEPEWGADDTGVVECTGLVGTGGGEISVSDDTVWVADFASNYNAEETTGLTRTTIYSNSFE